MYSFIYLCKGFWASEVKGARPCLGDLAVSPPYCPGIGMWGPSLPAAPLSSRGSKFKLCAHSSGTMQQPSTDAFADTMVSFAQTHTYTTEVCWRPFIAVFKRHPAVEEVVGISFSHFCLELSLSLVNCLTRFISWCGPLWAGFVVNPLFEKDCWQLQSGGHLRQHFSFKDLCMVQTNYVCVGGSYFSGNLLNTCVKYFLWKSKNVDCLR